MPPASESPLALALAPLAWESLPVLALALPAWESLLALALPASGLPPGWGWVPRVLGLRPASGSMAQ